MQKPDSASNKIYNAQTLQLSDKENNKRKRRKLLLCPQNIFLLNYPCDDSTAYRDNYLREHFEYRVYKSGERGLVSC